MGWQGGGRGVGWRIVVSVEELRGGSRGFRSPRLSGRSGTTQRDDVDKTSGRLPGIDIAIALLER